MTTYTRYGNWFSVVDDGVAKLLVNLDHVKSVQVIKLTTGPVLRISYEDGTHTDMWGEDMDDLARTVHRTIMGLPV